MFVDTKHCTRTISDEYGLEFDPLLQEIRTYYDEHGTEETVLPGVKDIIIKNDNTSHFLVTHRDKDSLMKRLERSGFQDNFLEIISKDCGFKEKPDPESFEYLIGKFGLSRNETVGIGDRDIDAAAARNAGIKAILISKRREVDADFRIETTEELSEILKKLA